MTDDPDDTAVERYAETVPETFAGLYLAQNPARLVIGFTDDLERHAAAIRSRVKDPDRIEFFEATYSERYLAELIDRVSEDGFERSIERDGLQMDSGYVDVAANRAVIGIWAPEPEAAAAKAQDLYGPAVRVEVYGPDPRERRAHAIESYELVTPQKLRLFYEDKPESADGAVDSVESDDAVTVSLAVNVWIGSARLGVKRFSCDVLLARPLGGRAVIDRFTGRQVRRRDGR
jgi:hypothetical protein